MRGTKSKMLLAHIRHASVQPDAAARMQPLRFGEWAFMHDGRPRDAFYGSSNDPARIIRKAAKERGSDILFASILQALGRRGALERGSPWLVDDALIEAIQRLSCEEGVASLTFLLSNRIALYALRFGSPLYQLKRNPIIGMPRHVAFASVPLTAEPWTPVPDGSLVRTIHPAEGPVRLATCAPSPNGGWRH